MSLPSILHSHSDPRGEPAAAQAQIRVAFVLDSFNVGGTELSAIRTAERLDPRLFRLTVTCLQLQGPLRERYERLGVPIRHFPLPGLFTPTGFGQALRLARHLWSERVDVVHSHDIYGNIFGVPAARLAGVRGVIASRRWWRRVPRPGLGAANRVTTRLAHRVVANCNVLGRLLEVEEGVAPDRIEIIPNFVEPDAFNALSHDQVRAWREGLGIPPDALVVGAVGRLAAVKDHATLLRAMAAPAPHLSQAHCVLIGEGELRASLEELATRLGISARVHFAGLLPSRPNPHHLLDISVLCSVSEGFPNSILEAMAAGRPVVATEVGGVPDAVTHGSTGLLVPAGDPSTLAASLEQLLASRELRTVFGGRGRDVAASRFSEATAMEAVTRLYTRLALRRSAG